MNNLLSSSLYNNETFYEAFALDLRSAEKSVIIESPFITTKRMNVLLPTLRELKRRGVRVIVNTRNPEEHEYNYAAQAVQGIAALQDTGVTVLYTVRHHRKLAIIDDKILWEGSLNILSQNDSCEIMRRSESWHLVQQMIDFTGLTEFM
jgi:phosphatidylserine/phosphatidylglycerophosphate/cardiolipin synthase-like enzyme